MNKHYFDFASRVISSHRKFAHISDVQQSYIGSMPNILKMTLICVCRDSSRTLVFQFYAVVLNYMTMCGSTVISINVMTEASEQLKTCGMVC